MATLSGKNLHFQFFKQNFIMLLQYNVFAFLALIQSRKMFIFLIHPFSLFLIRSPGHNFVSLSLWSFLVERGHTTGSLPPFDKKQDRFVNKQTIKRPSLLLIKKRLRWTQSIYLLSSSSSIEQLFSALSATFYETLWNTVTQNLLKHVHIIQTYHTHTNKHLVLFLLLFKQTLSHKFAKKQTNKHTTTLPRSAASTAAYLTFSLQCCTSFYTPLTSSSLLQSWRHNSFALTPSYVHTTLS